MGARSIEGADGAPHGLKESPDSAPTKLCECGCGEPAPIAARNNAYWGMVKGQPRRFIKGHRARLQGEEWNAAFWQEENRGFTTPCWIWLRAKDPLGYGRIRRSQVSGSSLAHIEAYVRARGPVPDDHELDHLCRQPSCINPEHLEPVPHAINLQRGRNAKLTPEAVEEIKRTHRPGTPLHDHALAEKFGVHPRTIYEVLKGKRWN